MSIRYIFQYWCYGVGIRFHFGMLFSTQPINLVMEEISGNMSVVKTPITYFINQKGKHLSIWHNSMLTLMKSGEAFFRIDIMYLIYLDVKYFLAAGFSMCYQKFAVKTNLTTMGHFFGRKLNYFQSDITFISIALKCQCLKYTSTFSIRVFCISTTSWRKIS